MVPNVHKSPTTKRETTARRLHPACKRLGCAVIHDGAAPPWSTETPEAKPPPQGLNACILPDARRALTSTRRGRKGHGTRRGLNAGPVNTLCKTTARVCGMRFVGHTWRKPKQRAEPPRRRAHHAQAEPPRRRAHYAQEWLERGRQRDSFQPSCWLSRCWGKETPTTSVQYRRPLIPKPCAARCL